MFLSGDFNCFLSSRRPADITRWRSDDFKIRHNFAMFLKITWSEQNKRGPYQPFMRRRTPTFTLCLAEDQQILDLIDGTRVLFMLIGFETSICLCQAHRLTTMELVYRLGRRNTLCAYVSHGGYILSRAVHKRLRLALFLRPLSWHRLKLTNPVLFRRRTFVRFNVWPTGGMNGKLNYAKFFCRLPRQPAKV